MFKLLLIILIKYRTIIVSHITCRIIFGDESTVMNLPTDFLNEMKDLRGNEYEAFLSSYHSPAVRGYRINTAKPCDYPIEQFGSGEIDYAKKCFYLKDETLGSSAFHHAGAVYIQEPSAMIPALVLNPHKGSRVLDLCASPGGKTGQLSALIGDDGVLVSNEINPSRNKTLVSNVERLGLRNTVVTMLDPKSLSKMAYGWFDYVLVDAPCSGEGMFRKNPEAITEWSLNKSISLSDLQKEIITEGAKCVRTGGFLVYSTCTFSARENEEVIQYLLNNGEFKLLPIPSKFPVDKGVDTDRLTGRLYPDKIRGEGHFVALLQRINSVEESNNKMPLRALNRKEKESVEQFLSNLNIAVNSYMYNNSIVIPPHIIPPITKQITVAGVKVGEIDKRLMPHHQFFSAYGVYFKRKIDFQPDSNELKRYLRGEEIETTLPDGWAVVTVCGCPIGGIKVSSCRAKNHYPKGLRIK